MYPWLNYLLCCKYLNRHTIWLNLIFWKKQFLRNGWNVDQQQLRNQLAYHLSTCLHKYQIGQKQLFRYHVLIHPWFDLDKWNSFFYLRWYQFESLQVEGIVSWSSWRLRNLQFPFGKLSICRCPFQEWLCLRWRFSGGSFRIVWLL